MLFHRQVRSVCPVVPWSPFSYCCSCPPEHKHDLHDPSWNPLGSLRAFSSSRWDIFTVRLSLMFRIFFIVHLPTHQLTIILRIHSTHTGCRRFKPTWEVPTSFINLRTFDERRSGFLVVCSWIVFVGYDTEFFLPC